MRLSTELQSWHFNQEPSEASLADKRSCTSPSALNSNGVFTQEIHSAYSRTNQGATTRPYREAQLSLAYIIIKGKLRSMLKNEQRVNSHHYAQKRYILGLFILLRIENTYFMLLFSCLQVTITQIGVINQWFCKQGLMKCPSV